MRIKLRTHPAWPNPEQDPGLDAESGTKPATRSGGSRKPASRSGFTLVETLVATVIAAIVLPSFYAALATGFAMVKAAREDQRATQVIVQRMEAVRLASYKTLQNPTSYPTNTTEYYYEAGKTNGTGGVAYTISYTWTTNSLLPPVFRGNTLLVTVGATWKSGNVQHSRSMQSYVARYGIQRYVSGN